MRRSPWAAARWRACGAGSRWGGRRGERVGRRFAAATHTHHPTPPQPVTNCPLLPPAGRLSVAASAAAAAAPFSLPTADASAGVAALPPSLWVTLGSLTTDGVALQLNLERDGAGRAVKGGGGGWSGYRVVGGALATRAPA